VADYVARAEEPEPDGAPDGALLTEDPPDSAEAPGTGGPAGTDGPAGVNRRDRSKRRPARRVPPEVYRRRRLAAVLGGVLLLVGLGLTARVLLYDAGLVDVEEVRVLVTTAAGTPIDPAIATVAEPQLREAAALPLGGPLVGVDTDAAADRVRQLPAVAAVEVTREWPHTVSVHVVQRTPLATVATESGPGLVDATGTVFPGTVPGPLPTLAVTSPGPADPATLAAVGVLDALPGALRPQVLTVVATVDTPGMPGRVALALTEGREVRFGSADRAPDKAAVLVPLLGQPGRVYDVTSPELPTIQR
jgi:cell division protein FtsQ